LKGMQSCQFDDLSSHRQQKRPTLGRVFPTGAGKTETMLATHVYRRLDRSLVLAPSDALRRQIAKKLISLGQ
jgi:superfamily II DNA or RNA helicase